MYQNFSNIVTKITLVYLDLINFYNSYYILNGNNFESNILYFQIESKIISLTIHFEQLIRLILSCRNIDSINNCLFHNIRLNSLYSTIENFNWHLLQGNDLTLKKNNYYYIPNETLYFYSSTMTHHLFNLNSSSSYNLKLSLHNFREFRNYLSHDILFGYIDFIQAVKELIKTYICIIELINHLYGINILDQIKIDTSVIENIYYNVHYNLINKSTICDFHNEFIK